MSDPDFVDELMRAAPPGEFDNVLAQLQHVGPEPLSETTLNRLQSEHKKVTCVEGTNAQSNHPLAQALGEEMKLFQKEKFHSRGITARYAVIPTDNKETVILRTYTERIDRNNKFAGSWAAEWTVQSLKLFQGLKQTKVKLWGSIAIHAYCFEDGNIQLRSTRNFAEKTVTASVHQEPPADDEDYVPPPSLEAMVVEQIALWEEQLLDECESQFEKFPAKLKGIRRVLPITRTRMKWDVVAQRNVQTLQNTVDSPRKGNKKPAGRAGRMSSRGW